ncbi:MAG: DNA polymerase III subunit beta [Lachnospiraceae bacterium]|nr:DNA polymerase III subunit beta [Lachnospiraceae bacterium]MCR5767524.1 DNA polymerase III subunit beta [Lachnospiraceae bacterium]
MKIICSKANLLTGINIVLKAVPAKTTMTVLECILIKVDNDEIKLESNDMELAIETRIEGEVIEEGSIAINAKIFSDIVRKLPDSDVTIESDRDNNTHINCDNVNFNIPAREGDEFPALPVIQKDKKITLSELTLKDIIRQTVFSISDNENNVMMTGELFEITGNKLRVVALDGHRISIRKVDLRDNFGNYKVIVPGKALSEIIKILSGENSNDVNIYFSDKNVMFELSDTIILSRIIEGEYYKIDQMISNDFETHININKQQLLNSIDRAMPLVKETDKKPIIIGIDDSNISLKMNTQIGKYEDSINITKDGKDILIGFNPKFIMDVLKNIDDESIDIYLINSKAPCFIKNKDESYIYLILPVNISNN